jgi:hypothetical protein
MSRSIRMAVWLGIWALVVAELMMLLTGWFHGHNSRLFGLFWILGFVSGGVGLACLAFLFVRVHRETGTWVWPWTKRL